MSAPKGWYYYAAKQKKRFKEAGLIWPEPPEGTSEIVLMAIMDDRNRN
jgi:hypothetical protein